MKKATKIVISFLLFNYLLLANNSQNNILLDVTIKNDIKYFSIQEFANKNNLKSTYYESKEKLEIIYEGNKFYFSPFSSFCKINQTVYHLTHPTTIIKGLLYIPIDSFKKIIEIIDIPIKITKLDNRKVKITTNIYDITDFFMENKSNGIEIVIQTNKQFPIQNIATSITSNNWLNISVLNSTIDSTRYKSSIITYPILKTECLQNKNSTQLSFLIKRKIDDIIVDSNNSSINILLVIEQASHASKIQKIRKQWVVDTIVLDAGHGGKDPGAIGNNLTEKNITLDIVKQLGAMIARTPGLRTVYTREEDIFVPLWKRTQIANNLNGDLFLSLHVNSSSHERVKGYETYLLRVGKTKEAIEVAQRENGVIALEQQEHKYKNFNNEQLIVATMAQNADIKSSEMLASFIQNNLEKNIQSKNRGIKQAGFHVLVGASMPNVLIEVGFLSNKEEAKQLSRAQYRRKIAKAIYESIIDYKSKYE